jgi:multiple antibiotic resistance protein
MNFELFVSAVISIFVMADPFGNIPIFLGLTGGMSGTERRYVITKASVIATIILVIFAIVGKPFMDVLAISLNSLRIAGGILLLLIAFDMLMGSEPRTKKTDGPPRRGLRFHRRDAHGDSPHHGPRRHDRHDGLHERGRRRG